MSIVLRASDVPETSRMEYWQHALGDTVAPLELRLPNGPDPDDTMRAGLAGALRVVDFTLGGPGGADRTPRAIRRSDPDLCKIDVRAAGRGAIAQDGRVALQSPGDLTLVDLSRPCRWAGRSPTRMVAVMFPRELLPLGREELARLTGLRIPGDRGAGALISSLALRLPDRIDELGGAEAARLGTAVLDLLTAALAAALDRDERVPPETRRRALLAQVHAHIEERLADPALTPAAIAAAHHVSIRYLHLLFEGQETTVADWIRRRRLERCRRDLADPALRGRPVASIGARWGLRDPSRFSRAFRAAYGLAPGEWRRLATRQAASQ